MSLTEIFTTGYPKSGVTWLNNLLGDMFQCKVTDVNNNIARDFTNGKESEYQVLKLHMPYDKNIQSYYCYEDQVRERCKKGKLIFIHRDPRAVFISAMHYRQVKEYDIYKEYGLQDYYNHTCTHYEAWVNSYLESDKADYILTYEDLHKNSLFELAEIQHLFNVNHSREYIDKVIKRHTFKNYSENRFYWKGKIDTWKQYFTQDMGKFITQKLGNFMLKHNYIQDMQWWKELPK
jgi:hypothetical protein